MKFISHLGRVGRLLTVVFWNAKFLIDKGRIERFVNETSVPAGCVRSKTASKIGARLWLAITRYDECAR